MVVNRHREDLLGLVLADHILVKRGDDFLRGRHTIARLDHRGLVLFADDIHAQFHAFIADEHCGTGNEFAHFVLALAAERAIKGVFRIAAVAAADLAHFTFLPAIPA
jgi:hypothetical protein